MNNFQEPNSLSVQGQQMAAATVHASQTENHEQKFRESVESDSARQVTQSTQDTHGTVDSHSFTSQANQLFNMSKRSGFELQQEDVLSANERQEDAVFEFDGIYYPKSDPIPSYEDSDCRHVGDLDFGNGINCAFEQDCRNMEDKDDLSLILLSFQSDSKLTSLTRSSKARFAQSRTQRNYEKRCSDRFDEEMEKSINNTEQGFEQFDDLSRYFNKKPISHGHHHHAKLANFLFKHMDDCEFQNLFTNSNDTNSTNDSFLADLNNILDFSYGYGKNTSYHGMQVSENPISDTNQFMAQADQSSFPSPSYEYGNTEVNTNSGYTQSRMSPSKKLKTDNLSERSTVISTQKTFSPSRSSISYLSPKEDYREKSEDKDEVFQYERDQRRDPRFIHNQTLPVFAGICLEPSSGFMAPTSTTEAASILSKNEVISPQDFDFSSVASAERQKKMKSEIRKIFITVILNAVLDLLKAKEKGKGFRNAIKNEEWFRSLIQRFEQFQYFFQSEKWYQVAKDKKELFDWTYFSENNEELKDEYLAFENLFSLLSGMFKYGLAENGKKSSQPRNFKKLSEVIGNKRFSLDDNIEEMNHHEFCQKVASSTVAKFFEFLKTWATGIYVPGFKSSRKSDVLSNDEKRQMFVAGEGYMRKRFANPEKYVKK